MKMKKFKVSILVCALISICSWNAGAQEINLRPPSPTQTIKQQFALSELSVTYSRPSAKGRVIIGDLVPYDAVWRTGANASTKISFGEDVKIAGKDVPKGEYALYTIPGKSEWTIILSKNTTLGGAAGYKQEEDLVRFKVASEELPMSIETFTIQFANFKPESIDFQMMWERTAVSFTISTDIDTRLMKQINEAMS